MVVLGGGRRRVEEGRAAEGAGEEEGGAEVDGVEGVAESGGYACLSRGVEERSGGATQA